MAAAILFEPVCKPAISVTKELLDNGLSLLIREERAHPVVSIIATVEAGLSTEGEYAGSGISHFVEHTIFKGTPTREVGAVEEEVKSFGGTINATTGLDRTNFYLTVPKEHFKKALELLEDVIFRPVFDSEEVAKEKGVILKEINLNKDDPIRRVMRNLWHTAYREHHYGLPLIGYEELFKGLERADLVAYHGRRYIPSNIAVTVVGDIDAGKALDEARTIFGVEKRRRSADVLVPTEPAQVSSRRSTEYAQINLGYLAMGYHTVELASQDLYALDVLAIIAGEWDGSRFNKRLVKDEKILYSINSYNYTPRFPGLFIIYGIGGPESLESAKATVLEEIERIKEEGIEADELSAAKNIVISNYVDSLETTGGLARAISDSEFYTGEPLFFERYVENVKKLDRESIALVARKYLNEENLSVSYLYPDHYSEKSKKDRPEKAYGDTQGETARADDIQKKILSNGIRLILKEDGRLPKISLVCAFSGGVLAEQAGNNGISNLTATMLLKGTKRRKEEEIRPLLEGLGGSVSHFSGRNTFGLSMEFLSEHIPDALDVLEDVIENPTFPEEEMGKEKEKLYAALKSQDNDVYSAGFLKLKEGLFKDHPYRFRTIGEAASLGRLKRIDLKYFHENFCVPDNMVISIVGDFEPGQMEEEIQKRFSDMQGTGVDKKEIAVPPLRGITEIPHSMKKSQSLIAVGFRGAALDTRDRFLLDVLASVLSGENGRLYNSVRDEFGLSYALGTYSVPGITTGHMVSYVATDRENLKRARAILLGELEKTAKGSITEKEVDLAKSALIGRQKISLQNYSSLAYQMALDETYGLGYDAYKKYSETISAITVGDVTGAAKKYLDFGNFAVVTITGTQDE